MHQEIINKIGVNFICGCRCSAGHWFLCDKHEAQLLAELQPLEDEETDAEEQLEDIEPTDWEDVEFS